MNSIYEEYWKQRSDLVEASKLPTSVSFSQEGYAKAMAETTSNSLCRWGMDEGDVHWTTYCGLPFKVIKEQTALIIVEWQYE